MQSEPVIPVMGWIAIATFVAGVVWSVLVWSLGRHIKRQDKLEEAVNGPGGLRDKLAQLVTSQDFRERVEKIEGTLEVLNDEGHQRERRIMAAIHGSHERTDIEMRELRRELGDANRRLDGMSRTRGR